MDRALPRYPLVSHALVALPSLLMFAALFAIFPCEGTICAYFRQLEEASPVAEQVFECISSYGNIPFYAAYVAVLYAGIRRKCRDSRRFVVTYLVALGFTFAAVELLKYCVGRPRPGIAGDLAPFSSADSHQSLPSAHMTETTVTTLPLMLRFGRYGLPLLAGFGNAAMGFSRIFLGEHHPTDILVSLAVGGGIAYAAWRVAQSDRVRRFLEG